MRFHHLLQKTDDELLGLIVESILKNNPRIKIGVRIGKPVARVLAGKIVEERMFTVPPEQIVTLDYCVPHVPQEYEEMQTSNMKINFNQLDTVEWSACPFKYIYPRDVTVPHRKWLTERQPGEEVMVHDDQYLPSPHILTEQDFINHEYCIFRFGGSMK